MTKLLSETYKKTKYKLRDHGSRSVNDLKVVIDKVEPDRMIDFYGQGFIINDFEDKVARILGKEKAVFFPSGTMAQQIALRMWCDERKIYRVAYHPLCHLEIYEQDGLKKLHNIETVLLGEKDRLFTIDDLKKIGTDISTLLIELPQNCIGGQLPTWDELSEILVYCKENNIKTHLDGARLWEAAPYYKKELNEICREFDSVYVSFYKSIGGVAGAILAGPEEFMNQSKVWKRRYGGDLISLYPYILSADYYMTRRIEKMKIYYEQSMELAKHFNSVNKIYTIPKIPVSNMFNVHFSKNIQNLESMLIAVMKRVDVGITPYFNELEDGYVFDISIGDAYGKIPKGKLDRCFDELNTQINKIM
ncbi:hypothetical protein SH1V18_33640 [Vallitalea longa]|uniref:Aromatic amino acid beta-eliminating lyase/threonine aldolase domain-containing protein n=1 Tax=Vallitalea longa TaxID=2936439 RepID=A0A9W5YD55_9FIRM|nr:beta-eliminating lyase-related protein [Vallitalea longa]GKX30884.1 hypothetical protein SH1V18_33640 [Vallitalea longa]